MWIGRREAERRTISTDRPYACVVFIELNPRIHEIVPAWRGDDIVFKHDDGSMFVKNLGRSVDHGCRQAFVCFGFDDLCVAKPVFFRESVDEPLEPL